MAFVVGILLIFIVFFIITFTRRENSRIAKHRQMKEAKSKIFKDSP